MQIFSQANGVSPTASPEDRKSRLDKQMRSLGFLTLGSSSPKPPSSRKSKSPKPPSTRNRNATLKIPRVSSSKNSLKAEAMRKSASTGEGMYSLASARKRGGSTNSLGSMTRNQSFDLNTMKLKNGRGAVALARDLTIASRHQMTNVPPARPRMMDAKPSQKYAGDGAFRK